MYSFIIILFSLAAAIPLTMANYYYYPNYPPYSNPNPTHYQTPPFNSNPNPHYQIPPHSNPPYYPNPTPHSNPPSNPPYYTNPPSKPPSNDKGGDKEAFLDAHNTVRTSLGLRKLIWSDKVANYASNYANVVKNKGCDMVHSGGYYGENLAEGSSLNASDAVLLWVNERQYYHHDTNTCDSGKACGHYTQVVWRNSTQLGCAQIRCDTGSVFVTCNYDPPGNYIGESPY